MEKRNEKKPDKLREFRIKDAEKHRQSRRDMSDEKRKEYNAKVRERMRKYRERKRMCDAEEAKKKTRNQIQKQREYWRLKKREQRSKMSEEQHMAAKYKRKLKYQESKTKKKLDAESLSLKKRVNIPQQSQLYADSVQKLITNCTPRKQRVLKERGIGMLSPKTKRKLETNAKIIANLKTSLKKLKQSQSAREKQLYYLTVRSIVGKHYVERKLRQSLAIQMGHWKKISYLQEDPLPVVSSITKETTESIKKFYFADASDYIPDRRHATRKVMTDTLKNSHRAFLSQNHETMKKVSLSTFIKHRPKKILTMDKSKFQSCLCEYCVNIVFKLESLNKLSTEANMKDLQFDNKFSCLKMTICHTESDTDMFKDKQCIDRNCEECGVHNIALHYQPLIEKMSDSVISWKRWELCSLKNGNKRQMLIQKNGTVFDLVKELSNELKPFASHVFIALWQRKQYKDLISNIPKENVVLLMDFAENYRCVNQDEIQAAYYQYQQATVFPVIAHYRCDNCDDGIVQESAVFISPDLKHDSAAAHKFISVMNDHLKETMNIKHEVQYSDGCAGQFKSKKTFQHISESVDHSVEKGYFGSRHGKSLCDSLGGIVKNQAAKYVRSRKGTIPDALALHQFCTKYLTIDSDTESSCLHSKRTFFYIDNIPRQSGSDENLLTVKGTQSYHSVRSVSPGIVQMRKLACFCKSCLADDGSRCENLSTVGMWETKHIQRKKTCQSKKKTTLCKQNIKTNESKKRNVTKTKTDGPEVTNENNVTSSETNSNANTLHSLSCNTHAELVAAVQALDLEPIQISGSRTICNSDKPIDANSLDLVPDDIPLKPTSELVPVVIFGDGNCLPRTASFLAFGHEDNHIELRKRIVTELTQNEAKYLDNNVMRKGKNTNGNDNVVKMFAMFSNFYMGKRLNSRSIQSIYRREVLAIMKTGEWMGMWQLASLANILRRPVVSVVPKFGTFTTRCDMHRVFYPFKDQSMEQIPVFIMWTSVHDKGPERDFVLNHFTALLPFDSDHAGYDSDASSSNSLKISDILGEILMDTTEQLSAGVCTPDETENEMSNK